MHMQRLSFTKEQHVQVVCSMCYTPELLYRVDVTSNNGQVRIGGVLCANCLYRVMPTEQAVHSGGDVVITNIRG